MHSAIERGYLSLVKDGRRNLDQRSSPVSSKYLSESSATRRLANRTTSQQAGSNPAFRTEQSSQKMSSRLGGVESCKNLQIAQSDTASPARQAMLRKGVLIWMGGFSVYCFFSFVFLAARICFFFSRENSIHGGIAAAIMVPIAVMMASITDVSMRRIVEHWKRSASGEFA